MAGAGRNRHAIDLLLSAGDLSQEAHRALLERVKKEGARGEELLIDDGRFDELSLLRKLANLHRTQFVASERLLRIEVPPSTLALIPKRLAEAELIFPVSYDVASATLQVVTPDPGEPDTVDAIKLASNARNVKMVLARPRAVTALIAKHYDKNRNAFMVLEAEWATARGGTGGQQFRADGTLVQKDDSSTRMKAAPPAAPSSSNTLDASLDTAVLDGQLDLVAALVGLLERDREDLADHSQLTARYVRQMAVRLGLPAERVREAVLAALLHDIGKHGPRGAPHHLTLLSCQASATLRERVVESYKAPLRAFDAVDLSHGVRTAIVQMYERYGGGGLPGKVQGTEISLGARLLTVADSFTDLVKNPANPYGRVLTTEQACSVLGKATGTLFDEAVVAALRASLPAR